MRTTRLRAAALACTVMASSPHANELPSIGSVVLPEFAVPVELADVDGDGHLDLLSLSSFFPFESINVHPGDGLGGYGSPLGSPQPDEIFLDAQVGDVDGDGAADIVWRRFTSLQVAFGAGDGTFSLGVDVPGGDDAVDLAVGDIDGDGRAEILTVTDAGNLRLHASSAPGVIDAPDTINHPGSVIDVELGDADGDGRADAYVLADGCPGSDCHRLSLRHGKPGGLDSPQTVTERTLVGDAALVVVDLDSNSKADALLSTSAGWELFPSYASGFGPSTLTDLPQCVGGCTTLTARSFADDDGDRLLDAWTFDAGDPGDDGWLHWRQTAPGVFTQDGELRQSWTHFAGRDVDRDGSVDRVWYQAANGPPQTAVVLRGDGHGGLRDGWYAALRDPHVLDLDGDGRADLLGLDTDADSVSVAHGLPAGRLGPFTPLAATTLDWLRVHDLDGDGLRDLVLARRPLSGPAAEAVEVRLASAPGVFAPDPSPWPLPEGEYAAAIEDGDLDGDGRVDLAWVGRTLGDFVPTIRSLLNDGAGDLLEAPDTLTVPFSGSMADGVLGDVDLDGDLDLLLVNKAGGGSRTAYNDGSGRFGFPLQAIAPGALFDLRCAALLDDDGDGVLDLLALGRGPSPLTDGGLQRFAGTGFGLYAPGVTTPHEFGNTLYDGLDLADIDGDGVVDVVGHGAGVSAWLGDGAGGYAADTLLHHASSIGAPTRVVTADLDGDGALDVVHTTGDPGLLLRGDGPWEPLGHSLAGPLGFSRLSASGPLTAGSLAEWFVEGVVPGASGLFVIGLSDLFAPFKGGVMVPKPDLFVPFQVDGQGEALIPAVWPAGIPSGTTITCQAWFLQGVPAATTAVRGTTP